MTQDTDLLLIAERLGHALDRIEKIETDLDTQAVPLQASVTAQTSALAALEAALSGIKALNQHVLANDLGALSSRVEEAGKQTETALAALSADISKVSHDLAAKVENVRAELSAVAATRHELSAERQASALNIEATRNEFSTGLAALRAEIEATAKKFATPQSVNPRGEWVDGEVYSRLDMVSVSGSSYISTIDGNRTKPKSGAAGWMVVAKRGGGGGGTVGNFAGIAGIVTIEQGGTNASTAEDARTNLGVADFVGAEGGTDGEAGRVPQPVAGDNVKYLRGDGVWATPSTVTAPLASVATTITGTSTTEAVTPAGNKAALDNVAMTRAPGNFLQSDAATSGRGIFYTGGTRQNVAGVPVYELAIEDLVPAASSTAELWGMASSSAATALSQAWAQVLAWSGNDLIYQQNGATPATDFRRMTWANVRSNNAGQRRRFLLTVTQGTATAPVLRIENVVTSGTASDGAGTDPDWLSASGVYTTGAAGYNYPAQQPPVIVPILGSLSTTERDTWFATGRFPAWVHAGGSAAGLITNTGFETNLTGWTAQGTASVTRITSDFSSGVACAEITGAAGGDGIRTDIGALPSATRIVAVFWAKVAAGTTNLSVQRGNGSGQRSFSLTTTWQRFVYASNEGTEIPSAATNILLFTVGAGITWRLDDVQCWQAGAITLPGVQGIGTVRDLTTIGGNQGRLVGITPCLAVSVPMNSIERPAESYTTATSVQLLGGAITGGRKRRLVSVSGNSSASVNLSLGTSSGGTQLVNAQAVNGDFDISTFASRVLAANSSLWLTFSGNTTASIVIQVTDL